MSRDTNRAALTHAFDDAIDDFWVGLHSGKIRDTNFRMVMLDYSSGFVIQNDL
jgi:hypothetical protein